MIALDWATTKKLVTYDGSTFREEDRKSLLKRLSLDSSNEESTLDIKSTSAFNSLEPNLGEESMHSVKSSEALNSPKLIVAESSCPLSLIYEFNKLGYAVRLVKGQDVSSYRKEVNIDKDDHIDAYLIYRIANDKPELLSEPITYSDSKIEAIDNYRRFYKVQKARVALQNQSKAFHRYFGSNGSIAIGEALKILKSEENSLLKDVVRNIPNIPLELDKIKGLGPRLWSGIFITANPIYFKTLSRYLRFCGLVNKEQLNNAYNRHAKTLYRMFADQVIMQGDPEFRLIYDKCKMDIIESHPTYTKAHIDNAARNRLATFLAKKVYNNCSRYVG